MADYIKNTPVSPLRESNISKYISMMSEVDTVKALLSTQTDTGAPPIQEELNAAYAISDMFQSIAKEGMTVSEILDYMYTNYKSSDIDIVSKKIKIIHTPKPYVNGQNHFFLETNTRDNLVYGKNTVKDIELFNNNSLLNLSNDDAINSNPTNPSRLKPNLVTIMHNDPKFRCGVRNSLELSTFWNLLSSIELSKMYPYLNATFKLPRFVRKSNQVFTTATVNQFLNGTIDPASVTENYKIFEAGFVKEQKSETGDQKGQTTVLVGTDTNFSIFTMPQTVNNFNEKFVGHLDNFGKVDTRATTIHDITRPFLTIHSFDIDIAPSQGLLSFKSGRISMTLHDRTRMTDIAPFVKPDLFGSFGAEIIVEYGWSHMDADDDKNYIAQFLNKSRVIEKYIITNSSFSIQKDGSVKIDLGIAMRGPLDIRQVLLKRDPSKGASTDELQTALVALQDQIANDQSSESSVLGTGKSLVRLSSLLIASINAAIRTAKLPKEKKQLAVLNKLLGYDFNRLNLSAGDQFAEKLNTALKDLNATNITIPQTSLDKTISSVVLGGGNKDEKLVDELITYENLFKSLQSALKVVAKITKDNEASKQKVVDKIIPSSRHDAYINNTLISILNKYSNDIYGNNRKVDNKAKKIDTNKYISFGSFITSLIGTHMTATGKFDEIQIIFYTANENCGAMSTNNIASFLIEKEKLELFLKDLFKEDLQFTLESIIKAVVDNFISVRSQPCYGFSALFKDKSDKSGKKVPIASEAKELDDSIDIILKNIASVFHGITGEITIPFKMPRIGISFDTLTTRKDGYNRTISKISLFDRNDNPFSSLNQITSNIQKNEGILLLNTQLTNLKKKYALTASGGVNIKEGQKLTKNQKAYFEESGKLIDKFIELGFIEERGGQLIIKNDKNGISSLKSGFKKLMPSTTYGTQNSGIITANVTTVNDGALNTVYLTRPDRNDAGRNYTVGFSKALPLRILPTQATVEIWGCPFINFAQYVFLDFETGTTIDNIYSVASLKHSITPGSFKTTLTLSYGDVYGKYETAAKTIEDNARARKAAEDDKKDKKKAAEKKAAESASKPAPAPATTTTPSTEESSSTSEEAEVKPKPSKPKSLRSSVQFENRFSFSNTANKEFANKAEDVFIFKFDLLLILNNGFKNNKNRIGIKTINNGLSIPKIVNGKLKYTKYETNSKTKFTIDNKLNDNKLSYIQTFYYDKVMKNYKFYSNLKKNISINNVFQDVNSYILIPIKASDGSITSFLPICVPKQNKNIFKIKQLPLTVSFEYDFKNSEITKNSIKNNFYDMNIANNIEAGYDSITIDEIKKSYKNKNPLNTWDDYLPHSLIKYEFHLANYSKTIVDPTNNKLSKSFLYCFYYFNSIENLDFFYNQIRTNFEIKNLTLNDRDFQSKESKYIVEEYDYEENEIPVNIRDYYDVKNGSDTEYLEYFNNLTNYVTKDIKEKRIIVIFDMNVIIDKHIKSLSTPVEIDKTI